MSGVARVQGHPDWSSGGNQYASKKFASEVQMNFWRESILTDITNHKYEKYITGGGDKVVIRTMPIPVIHKVTIGENFEYDNFGSPAIELDIDRACGYQFGVDIIQAAQADRNLYLDKNFQAECARAAAKAIEVEVLSEIYTQAHAQNCGATAGKNGEYGLGTAATPLEFAKATSVSLFLKMRACMREQDIPDAEELYVLVPASAEIALMNSDLKNVSITGDQQSAIRNGKIGRVAGNMMAYMTNNLPVATVSVGGVNKKCYPFLFGSKRAIAFASQLTAIDGPYKIPGTRKQGYDGTYVYGFKATETRALGYGYFYVTND